MIYFEEFKLRVGFIKALCELLANKEVLWSECTYITHALELNQRIPGIKLIRQITGTDLKESKRVYDAYTAMWS